MVQQERIQKIISDLNQFEFVHFENSNRTLHLQHNLLIPFETRLEQCNQSLPRLKQLLLNKNCPITTIISNRCWIRGTLENNTFGRTNTNSFRDFLSALKENNSVTVLQLTATYWSGEISDLCHYLQGNQTIRKFKLCSMLYNIRNLLQSIAKSSIIDFDLSENHFNYREGIHFKEILPLLKLKSLDLTRNKTHNKRFQNQILYGLSRNIFLQELYIDDLSPENRQKLEQSLLINRFIQKSFQIYLKNYGPKRLGLFGKIDDDTFIQLSRDPTKPKPLDRDVRTYISQFIPRTIQKGGFEYFLLWMENVQKCIRSPTKHPIGELVPTEPHIQFFRRNLEILPKAIQKLGLYAKSNNIVRTGRKSPFTNLSFGQTQKRGRKRKRT